MRERPDYEKYPVSDEEMGKRYKNWTESLARQMVVLYQAGVEVGGDAYVEKVKDAYRNMGTRQAARIMKTPGVSPEAFEDMRGIAALCDRTDDRFANFWDGYIENTPKAFEKEIQTCPVARAWSEAPELCQVHLEELFKALGEGLNPKYRFLGFSKLLPKGDSCCRYRIEIEGE